MDKDELTFKSIDELVSVRKNIIKQTQILEQEIQMLFHQLAELKSTLKAIDDLWDGMKKGDIKKGDENKN